MVVNAQDAQNAAQDAKTQEKLCPRCGAKYTYIEKRRHGGQLYYFAVHETRVQGRRRVRKCYLGPDRYVHAELFNPLGLSGLVAGEVRFLQYIAAINNLIDKFVENMDREKTEELLKALRELNATLQRLEHKLEKKLEELK